MKTYTQQEVNKALHDLNKNLEIKEDQKKEINKDIKSIKDNIKYYENLDQRQIKMF